MLDEVESWLTIFQYDVLLSRSAKDKEVVRGVAERLRGDGLRVWPRKYRSEWEIRPGRGIPAKVEAGLENSRVLEPSARASRRAGRPARSAFATR